MAGRTLWVANFDFEERLALERPYVDPLAGTRERLPEKVAALNRRFAPRLEDVVDADDLVAVPDAAGRLTDLDGRAFHDAADCSAIRFWGQNAWAAAVAERLGFPAPAAAPEVVRELNRRSLPPSSFRNVPGVSPPGVTAIYEPRDFDVALSAIADLGYTGWVAKAEYGASGRNALFRDGFAPTDPDRGWVARHLDRDGAVLVEPRCELVDEAGFQYSVTDDDVRFAGVVPQRCDRHGRHLDSGPPSPEATTPWDAAGEAVFRIALSIANSGYVGPLGIDVMRYRTRDGIAVRVAHDVNARLTMGRLAIKKATPSFRL